MLCDCFYTGMLFDHNTVYALTFARLDFRGFRGSAAISSRENLDLSGNVSPFVRRLHHKTAKMATIR